MAAHDYGRSFSRLVDFFEGLLRVWLPNQPQIQYTMDSQAVSVQPVNTETNGTNRDWRREQVRGRGRFRDVEDEGDNRG